VKVPVIRAGSRFVPPRVDRATLTNGMDVLVVERRDLPQVVGVLATRVGSIHDPPGQAGLASLALHTMPCGTSNMSAREVDERLGCAGATLEAATHTEHSTMRFAVVPAQLPAVVKTLAEIVRDPSFPPLDVCTEQGKRVDQLQQQSAQSWAIAMRVSTSLYFGSTHPYGRPPQGRPSTLTSITPDDLAHFHEAHWTPSGSVLVLVGDISLSEAVSLATDGFGSWSGVEQADAVIPAPERWGAGRICVVNRPGASQTVAAGVLPGPARTDPDYYALTLANAVWGGSATGRLVKNLRDRKGYSYGVRSFVISHAQHGAWKLAGHVQGNKTIAALHEVQRELSCIAGDKPITARELAAAKRQWLSGYAQHFEGSARIAQEVAKLWAGRLPLAELRNELDGIQAATQMDVNAAARKYATPGAAALLLVGDLRTMLAEAGRSELDDFVMLDTEGEAVRYGTPAAQSA
jgi:zinc protease